MTSMHPCEARPEGEQRLPAFERRLSVMPVDEYLRMSSRSIAQAKPIYSVKAYCGKAGEWLEVLQAYGTTPGVFVLELEDNATRLIGVDLVVLVEHHKDL